MPKKIFRYSESIVGLYVAKGTTDYSAYVISMYKDPGGKYHAVGSGWSLGFNFLRKKDAIGLMKSTKKFLKSIGVKVYIVKKK